MPATKTRRVTKKQAEAVLQQVAEWLGKQGYGQEIDGKYIPVAPTGPDAARHALGPDLVMNWDWPGQPTPSIILEGGPYDWAIEVPINVPGVWTEPYAGYALCIYREDS
jgi:hypothetical protein